ncbi:MAG: V-type ATP synthase subunit E [Oscillospiraceae bacterium]|nr:V-type ATP synthase subunit E [Oscillospiraceae bacterium]MBQ6927102.1 V-type ATP synthase subunit E [Oscillospiraceae bacterium]
MKGTEKIIAHIGADAKTQADAILAQAEARCAEIREGYEQQAKQAYAERIRAGVKANQDRLDSMERLAKMEGRKAILALKQDMVAESFDRACDQLVNLPAAEYGAFLAKLAVKASVTHDEEVVLNARDRKALGEKVIEAANKALGGGKLTLSKETGDFKGGLILRRGSIEANCTAELLVDLCREEMAAELAGVLFG